MYRIKFQPGDLCIYSYPDTKQYTVLIIGIIDGTHYRYEDETGDICHCHVASIMGQSLQLLYSGISSLGEARKTYPEYFI